MTRNQTFVQLGTLYTLIASVIGASVNLDGHCTLDNPRSLLQTQRKANKETVAPALSEVGTDVAGNTSGEATNLSAEGQSGLVSANETENDPTPPHLRADATSQAPEEGGEFSNFLNNHKTGRGIHKWLQYFPAYQRHLAKFIGKEVYVVEIGIQSGGSLAMWKSVFGSDAHIYGCDTDAKAKGYEDNNTKIFTLKDGDLEDPAFWNEFKKQVPRVDILVDAGGHTTEQMTTTLGNMLPHMSANGVYLAEAVQEDMWGNANPFWQLRLQELKSPQGKSFKKLGDNVSSVHIYPFLMVIELSGNVGVQAINRQLGTNPSKQPNGTHMMTIEASSSPQSESVKQLRLRNAFPWLQWKENGVLKSDNADSLLESLASLPPQGWLFIQDGRQEFSFDDPWDAKADAFMGQMISQFMNLHKGGCCKPVANKMQELVESLHIYPHLLIARRADSNRLIQAPRHGTQWRLPGGRG